jgi:hypothetical protein
MNRYDKAVLSVTSVVVDENLALAVVDRLVADEVIPLDIMCHSVNVLGEDGYLRLSTPGEAMAFTQDAELQWLITAMKLLGPPRREAQ